MYKDIHRHIQLKNDSIHSRLTYKEYQTRAVIYIYIYIYVTFVCSSSSSSKRRRPPLRLRARAHFETPLACRDTAARVSQTLSPMFERTCILGYPPFVKGLIDAGIEAKVPWAEYNLCMVFAG